MDACDLLGEADLDTNKVASDEILALLEWLDDLNINEDDTLGVESAIHIFDQPKIQVQNNDDDELSNKNNTEPSSLFKPFWNQSIYPSRSTGRKLDVSSARLCYRPGITRLVWQCQQFVWSELQGQSNVESIFLRSTPVATISEENTRPFLLNHFSSFSGRLANFIQNQAPLRRTWSTHSIHRKILHKPWANYLMYTHDGSTSSMFNGIARQWDIVSVGWFSYNCRNYFQ